MTVAEMIAKITRRTKQTNTTAIVDAIQTAYSWVHNRLYNSENGPNMFVTVDEELQISQHTDTYDLAANLQNDILAVKQLWIKFSSDLKFTLAKYADSSSPYFSQNDNDPTNEARGHPVYYDVINFNQVRFAPPLPAGTAIRVDYYNLPDNPDLTGSQPEEDVPVVLHEALLSKATGIVFDGMDDDRGPMWEGRALNQLTDALFVVNKRVQGPIRTKPFRARRRRYI